MDVDADRIRENARGEPISIILLSYDIFDLFLDNARNVMDKVCKIKQIIKYDN